MTAEGPWEIPPLDDAPDIARPTESDPEVLTHPANLPGLVLLIVGGVIAIVAALLGVAGWPWPALVCAMLAVVAALGGLALLLSSGRRPSLR